MKGHAEHDGQAYVPREELEEWAQRDPIERYAATLLASKEVTADDLAAIDRRIAEELNADVEFAEKCPFPEPGGLSADVPPPGVDLEPAYLRRLS
jgi:TPP-dependent pyruvate/acetoin dehydrogenase alpha subunit